MLRPLNKHLVVAPVEEVKTETGVLVPQGAQVSKNPYKLVEIIEVHENSSQKNVAGPESPKGQGPTVVAKRFK